MKAEDLCIAEAADAPSAHGGAEWKRRCAIDQYPQAAAPADGSQRFIVAGDPVGVNRKNGDCLIRLSSLRLRWIDRERHVILDARQARARRHSSTGAGGWAAKVREGTDHFAAKIRSPQHGHQGRLSAGKYSGSAC